MVTAPTEPELVEIAVEAAQPSGAAVGIVTGGALNGRRVIVGAIDPCGQCEVCRRGGAWVCPSARRSGPSRTRSAHGRWVVPLGDGLDLPVPAAAAVGGDVATAYTVYARTGLGPREPVAITGAGPIARFLAEILRAKGITPITLDDAEPDWRAYVAAALAAQGTGARPLRVIATDPSTLERAAALAGPRATLTVLATGPIAPLAGDLMAREVTVIGVAGPHPELIVEAAAMCQKGEIDLAGGVTEDRDDSSRAYVMRL